MTPHDEIKRITETLRQQAGKWQPLQKDYLDAANILEKSLELSERLRVAEVELKKARDITEVWRKCAYDLAGNPSDEETQRLTAPLDSIKPALDSTDRIKPEADCFTQTPPAPLDGVGG